MTQRRPGLSGMLVLVGLGLICTSAVGGDWPTYRADNARRGYTAESLTPALGVCWVYRPLSAPEPAWSGPAKRPREGFLLRHRVDFDSAFQVAVAGGLVYFGSSSDGKVYALDAATGREVWSFITGGPVRLAPAFCEGRVYFGSDDGYAYCLRAKDGKLLWKVRAGPGDERLLGNGRMICRWPVRTGVLVAEGVAYFAGGIFPHEDVYICAVRADDGSIVWKNGWISQADAYRNDLSPQGYLLCGGQQLFIPSGRALPVGFDRRTGRMLFRRSYAWRGQEAGGPIGGTYALLADEQIYTGTQNHLLALNQKTGKVGFGWFPGRRLAVVGDMAYLATGEELVAMKRLKFAEASRKQNALEYRIRGLRRSVGRASGQERKRREQQLDQAEEELEKLKAQRIEPAFKWRVPSRCDAELIVCENLVFAGGQGIVQGHDRQRGEIAWEAKVEGKACGLAVADGRLFVSTDTGNIYCFGPRRAGRSGGEVKQADRLVRSPYPQDELTGAYRAAAEAIVRHSGVKRGYCLILGAERGRLAYELAKRTELMIIAVERDAKKVAAARAALDAAGLYGRRVTIEQTELCELPYSNYFANLIVSDTLLLSGEVPADPRKVARHLKPCGGVVCLGVPGGLSGSAADVSADKLSGWIGRMRLGECHIRRTDGLWAVLKRGPLPGAGKWTHQYAEPGNTACSDDRIVGGPLGLLWFGEPGPSVMVNRHDAAAAPLALNGRMFVQGENVVMAYDSYNGLLLWKRTIPGAMRTRLKGRECGNLAVCEDGLYVAVGPKCLRVDPEMGQTLAIYKVPEVSGTAARMWGYVGYVDGILYGSTLKQTGVSDSVFAVNVADGKRLWSYTGKNIVNLTIAVGDGRIFFIDSSLTPRQREEMLRQDKSHLKKLTGEAAKKAEAMQKKIDARLAVALDARTGGKLWARAVDVTDCSGVGIGGGELTAMYRDGVVVLCGANANGHYWRQFLAGQFRRRRLVALSAKTGEVLWAKDANYRHRPIIVEDVVVAEPWAFDLKSGRQKTRIHPITGKPTVWQVFRPGHHCGAVSACPQMLFMRSGSTSYYDLREDSGIRHFAGHRLGCWINAIPADGLALMPEASAGCVCLFPIVCTVVLEPRPGHERWGIYSARGPITPVEQLAVNFGAPGDRRDRRGTLWLAYPRPALPGDRAAMGLSLPVRADFAKGGGFDSRSSEAIALSGTDMPWLYASCARGLRRCVIPLLSADDAPRSYTVRLYFANSGGDGRGKRVFDVKLQGRVVRSKFDIAGAAEGPSRAVVCTIPEVVVKRDLELELVPEAGESSSIDVAPALYGLEVIPEREVVSGPG